MALEQLTRDQRKTLFSAFLSAFPTYPSLNMMLQLQLNERLAGIAAPGPMTEVVLALVDWAETQGLLDELIAGALSQNPRNPKLKALGFELVLNIPAAVALEAVVRPHVPMQDPVAWRSEMERLEGSICRLELPAGEAAGTGFLIADDLVMTNCHVADQMTARKASGSGGVGRFGYRRSAAGAQEAGEAFAFADDWLVDCSPVAELDYAVIRLADRPGRAPVTHPDPYDFRAGDIYFILQHPLGGEMKLSAGVFERLEENARRISYTANTEPGSSGSPVFDISWRPVALHHAGTTQHNRGVILSAVADHGKVPGLWRR